MNAYQAEPARVTNLSWAAIFGGIVSSIGIGVLLSLLGLCLGFAYFEVDPDVMSNLTMGSVVWFIVGGTLSMFICGWVAGHLATTLSTCKGALHGLVAWGLATILGVFFVASGAGALVTGAGQLIGRTLEYAGKGAALVVPGAASMAAEVASKQGANLKQITKQVNTLLQAQQGNSQQNDKSQNNQQSQTNQSAQMTENTQQAIDAIIHPTSQTQQQLMDAISNYLSNTDQANAANLRNQVIDLLTKNTQMNREQASQAVDQWQRAYQQATEKAQQMVQQARDKAAEAAEKTSNILSAASLAAFATLFIGMIAAILGAGLATGARRRKSRV
jgi:hypothetical protein